MVKYKQLCILCKKNRVLIEHYRQEPVCYSCMKKRWNVIENKKYKELFDIEDKLYEENSFLRSVRDYYNKFGKLSQKQISAFKKTVKEMKLS